MPWGHGGNRKHPKSDSLKRSGTVRPLEDHVPLQVQGLRSASMRTSEGSTGSTVGVIVLKLVTPNKGMMPKRLYMLYIYI